MSLYRTVRALLEADSNAPIPDGKLDDQMWLLLNERIEGPEDLRGLPIEVERYYPSRLLQWEVGNGGFAQAAYSCSEWFPLAAKA